MYRMTYSNKGINGCSARGIAKRDTREELEELAETLKETICNVRIEPIAQGTERRIPDSIDTHFKEKGR